MLLAAAVLAGCGTTPYDPGPEPDVKAILTPQLDMLLPGTPGTNPLHPAPAVPTKIGAVEISPIRRAPPLAPAGWMACLRYAADGQPRYRAMFFNDKQLLIHRAALPVDNCAGERYALLRKAPGK